MAHGREDGREQDEAARARREGCDNFGCGGDKKNVMCCPECLESMRAEVKRLRQWVSDLQSGMYLNCVYCGHRYGPGISVEVLHDHIQQCPQHPLTRARRLLVDVREEMERLEQEIVALKEERDYWEAKYRTN